MMMQAKSFILILVSLSAVFGLCGQQALAAYCTAGSINCDEYISDVHVGTIHNSSTGCGSGGYTDYTAVSTELEINKSYQITVTNGAPYSGDQCGVWIDWNGDGDFDDSGETISMSGGATNFQAEFTVPVGASLGTTRLRTRVKYTGSVIPCGTTTYGEVEDYSVEVVSAGSSTVIHESATMGSFGQNSGWGFNSGVFQGSRFHLDQQADVLTIGGHLIEYTSGTVFGVIVSLSGPTALPQGRPFNSSEVMASATFTLPAASMDFRVPLSVTLPPGDYALIFGAGQFGASATSAGLMPYVDQSDLPDASYIFWSNSSSSWSNATSTPSPPRFVIEGTFSAGTIKVSGYVKTEGEVGISDVLILDFATSEVGLTDRNGYYEITVPAPWSGSLTPIKNLWSFNPGALGYCCNITDDVTDADFTGDYTENPTPTISGYVIDSDSNDGVFGVLMEASTGEFVITDVNGYYELTVSSSGSLPEPWQGSVTPSKDNWDFEPDSSWYANLTRDIADQNYVAAYTGEADLTVSGYIQNSEGEGIPYVQLRSSDFLVNPTLTDANGYYELAVSGPWSGDIIPTKTKVVFEPSTIQHYDLSDNISDQNFVGALTSTCFDDGWEEEWLTIYNGYKWFFTSDIVIDMAMDDSGNIYVTGSSVGEVNGNVSYDIVTIKYTPDGQQQWVSRYDGLEQGDDMPSKIFIDKSGYIYVIGCGWGTSTLDYLTIKYAPDSNVPLWAVYGGESVKGGEAWDIVVDDSGSVYVTGQSVSDDGRGGYCTIKYDNDGNGIWIKKYDGPPYDGSSSDWANAIDIDNSGNVYITGASYGIDGNRDIATIKYAPDGNELWVARYNGEGDGHDSGVDVIVDDGGNSYVAGVSLGSTIDDDIVLIKYDNNGNEVWVARYNSRANDDGGVSLMTFDDAGNILVLGTTYIGSTQDDIILLKYAPDSNTPFWTAQYNGSENKSDMPMDLCLDKWGNVYVTGTIDHERGSGNNSKCVTIKYEPDSNEPVWDVIYQVFSDTSFGNSVVVDDMDNVYTAGSDYGYFLLKYSQCSWSGDFNFDREVDVDDLAVLSEQWLQPGVYCADIAPEPAGDDIVNVLDFAAFAENWLEGVE